jgi:hypothetical protein
MKFLLSSIALLAFPLLAEIPSGWMVVKDRKGACQIGAPAGFKLDPSFPGLAKGPGDTVQVMALSSPAPVKPIMDSVAKMMHIEKLVDNTPSRLLYQNAPTKGHDGNQITGWVVKVPNGTGNCSAEITVVPGGQEDLVKKIAATIGPAK